jgi:hypothetical protein
MLLYTAATSRVISVVIVVERKEEGQEYPPLIRLPTFLLCHL